MDFPNKQKYDNACEYLIAWVKMRKARKIYKAKLKRMKYRLCVIKEVIKTESDYTRDLQLILDKIYSPLIEMQIIPSKDTEEIFINLQEIAHFNQEFLASLQKRMDNNFPFNVLQFCQQKTVFGDTPEQIIGFKVYFDFCNGFSNALKVYQKLQQDNKAFLQFMNDIKRSNVLRGMNLEDFLVKPVQRLPKYVLLLKDLLKHTDQDHPDCLNIKNSLEGFQNVNDDNNKNMDKFLNRIRMQEFQNLYDIKPSLMEDPERLFRFEETQTMIWNEIEKPVYVYALTDVILVTFINEQGHSELFKVIYINTASFVKDPNNSKTFKNLYSIVGKNDAVQFIGENLTSKKSSIAIFEKLLIQNVQILSDLQVLNQPFIMSYPLAVNVVGTEERNFQSFSKHTIYITEITILKIVLKIFVRYREIQKLSEEYKKRYRNIKFPDFPRYQWMKNQQTKVIESRKILIENFLQVVLSSEETRGDFKIIEDLKLPRNFYELPDIIENEKMKSTSRLCIKIIFIINELRNDYRGSLKQFDVNQKLIQYSASEVLKARNLTMQQEQVHISSIVKTSMGINMKSPYQVKVYLFDGNSYRIGIDENTRAAEVVEAIANQIKLKYFYDFRIFLVDQLENARMIDDDEVINNVLHEEVAENNGILNKIIGRVESVFFHVKQTKMRLQMRKFMTLPIDREEFDLKKDSIRLNLISHQILHEVKTQHYDLNFQEYCFYAAIFILISYKNINVPNILLEIIPKQFYESIVQTQWKQVTQELMQQISQETNSIATSTQNTQMSMNETIMAETTKLTQRIIFNSIKTNKLYGISLFFVEMSPKTREQEEFKTLAYPNIYLGINCQYLLLLTPSRKEIIKQYNLTEITTIQSYPMQIVCSLNHIRNDLKFMTYQSYEIKMLVEKYQGLIQFNEQYEVGLYEK